MKKFIIFLIQFYQKTISPDHGLFKSRYKYGFCRFYPTCSEYAVRAITDYGLLKGVWLSGIRILRCNPFVRPQVDKP